MSKRSVESILNERRLLASLQHRFIVIMVEAFQDQEHLYIVMNLMEGGDLRYGCLEQVPPLQNDALF